MVSDRDSDDRTWAWLEAELGDPAFPGVWIALMARAERGETTPLAFQLAHLAIYEAVTELASNRLLAAVLEAWRDVPPEVRDCVVFYLLRKALGDQITAAAERLSPETVPASPRPQ